MSSSDDLEVILEKWYNAKKDISILEKKCDNYKKTMEKLMDRGNTNSISSRHYEVSRKENTRTSVSKASLPADLWNTYSREVKYFSYGIVKK